MRDNSPTARREAILAAIDRSLAIQHVREAVQEHRRARYATTTPLSVTREAWFNRRANSADALYRLRLCVHERLDTEGCKPCGRAKA